MKMPNKVQGELLPPGWKVSRHDVLNDLHNNLCYDLFTTPNILTMDRYKQLYEHSLLRSLLSRLLLKVAWSWFGFGTLLLLECFFFVEWFD